MLYLKLRPVVNIGKILNQCEIQPMANCFVDDNIYTTLKFITYLRFTLELFSV